MDGSRDVSSRADFTQNLSRMQNSFELVHALPGNRTHDLEVASIMLLLLLLLRFLSYYNIKF